MSVGTSGDYSAKDTVAAGNVTFDAAAATTGAITLTGLSAGNNVTISMGTGTGGITLASAMVLGGVTIDASTFGGAIDIGTVTASGAAVVSTGTAGDLSATEIHTTGLLTIDAARQQLLLCPLVSPVPQERLRLHSVQEVVISMLQRA